MSRRGQGSCPFFLSPQQTMPQPVFTVEGETVLPW